MKDDHDPNLITSKRAAQIVQPPMTVAAFRKAADRSRELREARTKIGGIYLYDREKVINWAATAKRNRS